MLKRLTALSPLMKIALLLMVLLGVSILHSCTQKPAKEDTFTGFPGFKKHLAQYPPASSPPNPSQQALLQRYRPRLFFAKNQPRNINFYQDYIANGKLYSNGKPINQTIDQALLNRFKDDPSAEFRYTGNADKPSTAHSTVVYARYQQDTLSVNGQDYPLTFLVYNLVFPHSGLLKGLDTWQRWAMTLIGGNTDWHQLDHYVGLSVVLYQKKPIAVMLQQHNYQTTYIIGKDMPLPADDRIAVDIAMQSNELYPHTNGLQRHPAVSFVKADNIAFMLSGKNKPTMAGWDITHGEEEQAYKLAFLAPNDAFYTFKGRLGEKRLLPGRDGPPGAQYVTLPALMPMANQLVSGYKTPNIAHEQQKIAALFNSDSFSIDPNGLEAYRHDFTKAVFSQ